MLLVSRAHPLADRDEIRMEELRKESWIVRAEAHPVVEVLQRSAHEAGFEPTIGFLANDYQEAQAMVSVGMGVAMVPKTAVALQHPDVRVISLGSAAPLRRVLLAQRQDKVYAPAEVAFQSDAARNRPRTRRRLPVATATGWTRGRAAILGGLAVDSVVPQLLLCARKIPAGKSDHLCEQSARSRRWVQLH